MTALDGKTAVVTGASRGVGAAVAERLAGAGARTYRMARSLGGDEATMPGCTDVTCDVTVPGDVERAFARVRDEAGPPDILVNTAGVFLLKAFDVTTAAAFREQLDTNLVGAFHVLKTFVPAMVPGGGHVVTVGSVADWAALPGNSAYAASKFGLRGLHEVLKAEYAGTGLRMTLVSPGPTDTGMWDPVDPDQRDDLPNRASMLQPNDVADVVLFAVTRPARATVDLVRLTPS